MEPSLDDSTTDTPLAMDLSQMADNQLAGPPPPAPRPTLRDTFQSIFLERTIPLSNGSPTDFQSPAASTGARNNLLPEILDMVITQMDLGAVMTLRNTNRSVYAAVDKNLMFAFILKHARVALRAILALELGKHITVWVLLSESVSTCG